MTLLRTLLIMLLTLLPALPLRADKTLRGKLRTAATAKSENVPPAAETAFDTICAPAADRVRLSGYDKPLGSRVESLFVSNSLGTGISEIEITLDYTDMQGRTLHQAVRRVRADIPSGTTRRIQFPSWDTQNSFYYRHSRRPRTANVTPYDVSCKVNSCVTLPMTTETE